MEEDKDKEEESNTTEDEVFRNIWIIRGAEKKQQKSTRQWDKHKQLATKNPDLNNNVNEMAQYTTSEAKFKSKGWHLPHIVHRGNRWVVVPAKPHPLFESNIGWHRTITKNSASPRQTDHK